MRFHFKKYKFLFIEASLFTMLFCTLFLDGYVRQQSEGDNFFHVFIQGEEVGTVEDEAIAEELLAQARREIAEKHDELVFIDADFAIQGEEVLWGPLSNRDKLRENMRNCLENHIMLNMHQAYTLKVNEYMVNLGSASQVQQLLQVAIDKYATEDIYEVNLVWDPNREQSSLTASVDRKEKQAAVDPLTIVAGGVEAELIYREEKEISAEDKTFDDFDLGLKNMNFSEKVEIVEAYLPESQISMLDQAIEEVVKEQETPGEYKIQSGDTLSEIAIKVNIPVDKIVELNNDKLENENSMIRVGDTLIITVPEPELSVERTEEIYCEEIYDADVIYIENNGWYTNQTVLHQQPSAGFRKVIASVNYMNDKEVSREVLKEEVLMEAVPKIVERGTKIPPTYIRPISGGRQTSGFGKRKAPTKGASTYHKGVDWAVPTGTAVYASCGGTVAKAGWGSGYGYVVYINHEDGRQTRYGHLSKVLVKSGQKVKQGERIALSGNTGVSTGPHLHFEILIGGSQVNPLKYLN